MFDDVKYSIRNGESEEDYIIRIGGYHDVDKLSWFDICDIINEKLRKEHSESYYRKRYKSYLNNVRDLENTESDSFERYKETFEKLPYYREQRKNSRYEMFYKSIAEKIKILEPPAYIRNKNNGAKSKEENVYILTLADLHIGANFKSVNNEYSLKIVEERFNTLFKKTVDFIVEKDITTLNIISLGDIIQGMLRISDMKLNETSVVDSFVFACRILSDFINKLSEYCYICFAQVCYSNHDQIRYLGTKASELASEDMGKILFSYLTDVLSNNKRVKIIGDPEKDYYHFNIFDFEAIALHGHQVNNITSIAKDLSNRHRKFFDYVFLAHSHSAKELISGEGENHDVEILVAPSFVGSCPYADKLMVGSKAACKIFEFNKCNGHIASYKIILN